jgi:hypothetical protein
MGDVLGLQSPIFFDLGTTGADIGATKSMQNPVNLGGPTMLFLHSRTLAPGNMIHGDGRTYNVLETIDLAGVPYGGIAKKETMLSDMDLVTFDSPEELSTIEVFFTDHAMRKLTLPFNAEVNIILRVMHTEDDK